MIVVLGQAILGELCFGLGLVRRKSPIVVCYIPNAQRAAHSSPQCPSNQTIENAFNCCADRQASLGFRDPENQLEIHPDIQT